MARKSAVRKGHQRCNHCQRVLPLSDEYFPPYYHKWWENLNFMTVCWDCRYEAALSRMGTVKGNPVISFVRDSVRKAIDAGYLARTGICVHCGGVGTRKHHPNYRRPLQVEYCCEECHQKYHHEDRAKNRLEGKIPEHHKRLRFRRQGKKLVPKPGAPKFEVSPYTIGCNVKHWRRSDYLTM